ncbi:hypothetical protein MMC18_008429 [Xylographa bjoerkii]|nr:hypothetical protein [Xylographa bjoerkii]
MQTIWSRAIQAKSSCRCPSCLPKSSAITRRPSTAAAGRSIRYGDIATFFYSSILATAAVADAERKDVKRKRLDKSIAEAVEALKAVELEQHKRLQTLYSAQHELRVIEKEHERRLKALRKTMGKTNGAQQSESVQNSLERSGKNRLRSRTVVEVAGETPSGAKWTSDATAVKIDSPNYSSETVSSSSKHKDDSVAVPADFSRGAEDIIEAECRKRLRSNRRVRPSDTGDVNVPLGSARSTKLTSPGILTEATGPSLVYHKLHNGEHALPKESVIENTKATSESAPYKLTSLAKAASEWLSYDEGSMDLTKGRPSVKLWSSTPWAAPPSDHKLLVMNASIAKLIYRLLLMSLDGADADGVVLNVKDTSWVLRPEHRPELHTRVLDMNERLAKLKEKVIDADSVPQIPFPRYSNRTDCRVDEDFLHKSLQTSLAETSSIDDLLPKICYDLLISETPPSIHTYNMLIIRLCYLQHYQVASAVIDSLFECRLRPNEITTAAILRFYSNTNDFDAFSGYVNLMNAERNHGLMTASITTKITPENKNHFVVLSQRDFSYSFRKRPILSQYISLRHDLMYIEKAPRNRDTYAALICGWLSFSDLRSALREYVTMIRSGWKADESILTALLSHCALKKRWDWGAMIWGEIVETCERPDSIAYYWMLHLCAWLEKSEMFDTVLQHGVTRQMLPADMRREAFAVPIKYVERDNRLLEMLREYIQVPGLVPLIERNQKVTEPSTGNITSILSDLLEDVDGNRLARAREHMVDLNTIADSSFEHADVLMPLVIVPCRYTTRKSPSSLSRSSPGKSRVQSLSSIPKLAARKSGVLAQVSHIPVENSPNDGTVQPSEATTPRRRSPCWHRRTALRAARFAAEKETQQEASSLASAVDKIENIVEKKESLADHPRTELNSLPSVPSVAIPGDPEQMQACLTDNGMSHVTAPLGLPSTATSGFLEPMTVVSNRNVNSQKYAPSTIACVTNWESPERSNATLAESEKSQADMTLTVPSAAAHVQSTRVTIALNKSEECQLAKHFSVPSEAARGVSKGVKIVLRQNDKRQAAVPLAFASSHKDDPCSIDSGQPSQLSMQSVGHNSTYFVLNLPRETQASTRAEA